MKKLVVWVLVVVLLVLATSVASAAQPPGVEVAIRVSESEYGCSAGLNGSSYGSTKVFTQYSNGARGHSTLKCKLELVSGSPQEWFYENSFGNCTLTISLEGKKGMLTRQCVGDWNP